MKKRNRQYFTYRRWLDETSGGACYSVYLVGTAYHKLGVLKRKKRASMSVTERFKELRREIDRQRLQDLANICPGDAYGYAYERYF